MTDISHMDSDLMCPSRLKNQFEVGYLAQSLYYLKMGNRGLSILDNSHLAPVIGRSADRSIDQTFVLFDKAIYERPVFPHDLMS